MNSIDEKLKAYKAALIERRAIYEDWKRRNGLNGGGGRWDCYQQKYEYAIDPSKLPELKPEDFELTAEIMFPSLAAVIAVLKTKYRIEAKK